MSNIAVTEGSGKTVAVETIGAGAEPQSGDDVQFVRLAIGAIGSGQSVQPNNPLPVLDVPFTVITVTPVVSTGVAYSSGDAVGGKQTLAGAVPVSGGDIALTSITVVDKGNQKKDLTILFFDSNPAAATITDNAALVFSTDVAKLVGMVKIVDADYTTINGIGVAVKTGIDLVLQASGSTSLYAAVVTDETPTYASASDLVFKYGFK